MRTKKPTTDFRAISRRSMQREFKRVQTYPQTEKRRESEDLPRINAERRVAFVGEGSNYYKYRQFIVGKLVRLIRQSSVGGWVCQFVHDDDRMALNNAAGWSDAKDEYLFDDIKLK